MEKKSRDVFLVTKENGETNTMIFGEGFSPQEVKEMAKPFFKNREHILVDNKVLMEQIRLNIPEQRILFSVIAKLDEWDKDVVLGGHSMQGMGLMHFYQFLAIYNYQERFLKDGAITFKEALSYCINELKLNLSLEQIMTALYFYIYKRLDTENHEEFEEHLHTCRFGLNIYANWFYVERYLNKWILKKPSTSLSKEDKFILESFEKFGSALNYENAYLKGLHRFNTEKEVDENIRGIFKYHIDSIERQTSN